LGMEEVRKELVGMKNREWIKNYVCVIVVSINLVFVLLCTLLEHERNTQAKTILFERHTIGSLMLWGLPIETQALKFLAIETLDHNQTSNLKAGVRLMQLSRLYWCPCFQSFRMLRHGHACLILILAAAMLL
jgi:hypothetical protein